MFLGLSRRLQCASELEDHCLGRQAHPSQHNAGVQETRSDRLVSRPSWPWTNGHPDSLLHHEALQDDGGRGHRLDPNLQAWLRDWATATVLDDVSSWKALVMPRERMGLDTDWK